MEHEFTKKIIEILKSNFGKATERIFSQSEIIQYLNIKTKSASKGSKSRGSFANLYAIYVLLEDYSSKGFDKSGNYSEYEGAVFLNQEFKKYFPTCDYIPILRSPETNRYWFNENLIKVEINKKHYNLAKTIIQIIDNYVKTKKNAFEKFIQFCESSQKLKKSELVTFISSLIEPTVDARIFEIVSYSILKYYYYNQNIFWGFEIDKIQEDSLKLFKTGRTNANDGGIDFVMKPLGRFFQVTETVDVNKYFLDIDKIEKYPITFVIKSSDPIDALRGRIQKQAEKQYSIKAIVSRYMNCIEEIINVPVLLERFREAINKKHLNDILTEITKQSKVEFSYEDDYDIADYENIQFSQ